MTDSTQNTIHFHRKHHQAMLSGEKVSTVRWNEAVPVGRARFVFDDDPTTGPLDGTVLSVRRHRLDTLTAEQAHQPAGTDMAVFARQLRENYYPEMPDDAVVEVAELVVDTPPIAASGSTVFHREFGDPAAPPLVLIHGLYGDSSSVVPVAEALARQFRVIAPDMLGHGRSSRPEHFTLADQGAAVNDLIAALGYDTAAVVGISMGSYVAAQAAILDPARTTHLVLVVSKAHGTTSSVAAYIARRGIDTRSVAPEELLQLIGGALWSPDTPQERRDAITGTPPAGQVILDDAERAAVERSLAGFDLRPDLPRITARTLVLSGGSDGLNPPAAGEELAALIPDATFRVYEHSGHMLTDEEPERFIADVTAFISSTATGPR
ncbi:alpha/beta fold hydrolase [Curtobacterium sp. VKM Ac-2922]|uniref:alpha/beta fold hydrolase n=1 Tax=Curtobacterium sp. VKM Ac-2922 TaxID=2929475 RepID=UPI001FB39FB8|nr:alpha/beta fold hydrolase [Curtobacterium sp. VKM Ac-2922]MCJ1712934.1 alpha/beta fold hydrolase [Curtobacterium sp. VKM Ac-2922]